MSDLATIAKIIGGVVNAAGTAAQAAGTVALGEQEKADAYASAHDMESQGRAEFAAAQQDAFEAEYQGDLVMSRQQALAAASGGGAGSDAPTIVKLLTDTGERAFLAKGRLLWGGETTELQYNKAARERRATGDASLAGRQLQAAGIVLGGIGDLFGA